MDKEIEKLLLSIYVNGYCSQEDIGSPALQKAIDTGLVEDFGISMFGGRAGLTRLGYDEMKKIKSNHQ